MAGVCLSAQVEEEGKKFPMWVAYLLAGIGLMTIVFIIIKCVQSGKKSSVSPIENDPTDEISKRNMSGNLKGDFSVENIE